MDMPKSLYEDRKGKFLKWLEVEDIGHLGEMYRAKTSDFNFKAMNLILEKIASNNPPEKVLEYFYTLNRLGEETFGLDYKNFIEPTLAFGRYFELFKRYEESANGEGLQNLASILYRLATDPNLKSVQSLRRDDTESVGQSIRKLEWNETIHAVLISTLKYYPKENFIDFREDAKSFKSNRHLMEDTLYILYGKNN